MEGSRVASVLVVDLVGSTERLVALGDDAGNRDQVGVLDVFSAAITDAGGRVIKDMGDGVLAVFDSVRQAVGAAVELQRATVGLAVVGDRPAQARVGVSVGEVGVRGDDLVGLPVVEAARLCGASAAGQILVSDIVLSLGRLEVPTQTVGALDLKGLPEPVAASEIRWAPPTARPPLPPGLLGGGLPFSGRADALAALDQAWSDAVRGEGRLVLVAGEPGIGKTRLVAIHAEQVHADGALVAFGRCDELSALTYQPFVEALRGLLHADVLDPVPPGLGWLLPEVASVSDGGGDGSRAQVELLDAVVTAVRRAASTAPLLLVLDDLHWASAPTLAVLTHLLGALDGAPVLVVGTFRDTDVDRRHPLGAFLADRRRTLARVDLAGLDENEVLDVLSGAAGHDLGLPGRDLARAVERATGGNAFFLGELLASLVEQGALAEDDGQWRLTEDLADLALPEGIRDILGRRLSQLPDGVDAVLAVAAVIGRTFDTRTVAAVSDLGIDEVVEALDAAIAANLVVEEPVRPVRLTFTHALVQQVLLEELSVTRQARLHERVGDTIAASAGDDADVLREAALHLLAAAPFDTVERAIGLVRRSDEVSDFRTPEETLELVALVEQGVADAGTPPSEDLALVLVSAASAAFYEGDRSAVGDYAERAVVAARASGADAAFARAVAIGCQASGFGLDLRFLPLVPEALERAGDDRSARLILMSQAHLAASLFADGSDPKSRTENVVSAIDELMAGPSPTIEDLKTQAAGLGMAPWGYLPEPDLARMAELVQAAVDHSQTVLGGMGHLAGCYAALRAGDVGRVRAHIAGMKAIGFESPVSHAATAQNEATLALFEGRLDEVPDLVDRVAAAAPGEPMFAAGVAAQRAWLAHLLGRQDEAVERSRDFGSLFPYPRMIASIEGLFALAADDRKGARRFLEAAWADGLATVGRDWCWVGTVHTIAELVATLGDRERVAEVEAALVPFSGQFALTCCVYVSGSVDATLGRLARLRGDEPEAQHLLTTALALEERSGAVLFAERTRRDLGA